MYIPTSKLLFFMGMWLQNIHRPVINILFILYKYYTNSILYLRNVAVNYKKLFLFTITSGTELHLLRSGCHKML